MKSRNARLAVVALAAWILFWALHAAMYPGSGRAEACEEIPRLRFGESTAFPEGYCDAWTQGDWLFYLSMIVGMPLAAMVVYSIGRWVMKGEK